jgi:hypothetical protein
MSESRPLLNETEQSWLLSGTWSNSPTQGYRRCVCGEWDVDHDLLLRNRGHCDRPGCDCERMRPRPFGREAE